MAYIGKQPVVGNFQICDAIATVNGQAAYTMQVSSVNVSPESANHMIVSLNGTIQKPNSSYTVSGSTITFSSNLATGDVIDFIQILGDVLSIGTPSDATVTTAKLADSSVSLAKLTATGTKSSSTFLRGDNTFDTPPLGGITMADQWRLSASSSVSSGAVNKISSNWERTDSDGYGTIGSAMSESSGVFTFPATGIYHLTYALNGKSTSTGNARYMDGYLYTSTDGGSSVDIAARGTESAAGNAWDFCAIATFIFDVTNTSNCKIKFNFTAENGNTGLQGNTDANRTVFTFIRLGDT